MSNLIEEIVSFTHREGDKVMPHSHSGIEIIAYAKGMGVSTVEKEEFNYNQQSLFLIPAKKEHFERTLQKTDVRSCAVITEYFKIDEPIMITGKKYATIITRIYDMLDEMSQLYLSDKTANAETLESNLNQLLYTVRYLKESYQSNFDEQTLVICNNTKKYIRANFHRDIAFEILAENIGYSYDRFRHIFVEVVGMGLKAYQQGIRMSNAKNMLTFSHRPVKEIALVCGYKNPVCFMNYFKRSMGLTPSQYRKISRKSIKNNTYNPDED